MYQSVMASVAAFCKCTVSVTESPGCSAVMASSNTLLRKFDSIPLPVKATFQSSAPV